MENITHQKVLECLEAVGITQGDGLLVHSAVQYLGRPIPASLGPIPASPGHAGGVGMYLEAIQQAIGKDGTIAVPTFNFAFAQGQPYDPQETPSQGMGAFSEFVRQHPDTHRTSHPMQSLAVLGRYAADLASRDTLSAFDPGSAFERMLELDFKLLLLGADVRAVSIFHYSEQRFNVPYRYWKDFHGQVLTTQGWQERTYRMFVRNLDLNPHLTADPVQRLLQERGQWRSIQLNYGHIASCRLRDFVTAVDHFLAADPWSLVTNRPER